MTAQIRSFVFEDKPSLMALLRDTPEFTAEEVKVAEELCDCYLEYGEQSDYHIFVGVDNSNILGYICYGPTPITSGTWDVYWMAVSRAARGQGLGKKLLTFAENNIRETGGRLVMIETSSKGDYEPTRQFYYAMGYVLIANIPDFYAHGDDKLILWKRLRHAVRGKEAKVG